MTKEEIIKQYGQRKMGGAQYSASSKSASATKEKAIKVYEQRKAAKTRERQMMEIANRTLEAPTYESYIPEEYRGTYESESPNIADKMNALRAIGADVFNYNEIAEHITDDELKLLSKMYKEEGLSIIASDAKYGGYVKNLKEEIDRRRIEKAAYDARTNDTFLGKVGTSVKSVGNNLMSVAAMEGVGNAINGLLGYEIDETPYYQTLTEVQRQAVSEDMSGFGKFLYDTGMSMADNVVMTAIGSLIGGGGGAAATKVAEMVTMIGMGSQAMSSTIVDAKQKGKDDVNAVAQGVLAGIAEAYFEKRGLGALFDRETFKKSIGRYLFANVFQNAVEEAETEAANIIADSFIEFDKSNFNIAMQEYKSQGMSDAGAAGRALLSSLGDVALSAASGALMGLGFGGVGGIAQNSALRRADTRAGKAILDLANAGKDLYGAAKLSGDADVMKSLEKLAKAKEGSRSQYRQTGKLARQVEGAYNELNDNGNALTQKEVERLGGTYEKTDFENAYEALREKVKTAKQEDLLSQARTIGIAGATPEEYGSRYTGEAKRAFDEGLAAYDEKTRYKYPLWFEIAVKLGRDSNGKSITEMINTLSRADRKGVLTLSDATLNAAFEEGKRIERQIADEQKAADERRQEGEKLREERKRAVEAEAKKNAAEGKNGGSASLTKTEENTSNVIVSKEIEKISKSQQSAIDKIKRVMKLLPGYQVYVQYGHEGDGKLGNQNAYFDQTTRMIYLNIDAGKRMGTTEINGKQTAVELYEAALEAALTHEVVHAIREDSPRLYSELRDFVRTNLYRDMAFENFVEMRRKQYAAELGREISYEYAEEEVICNSLGTMLTNERVMDMLAGKHRNLFSRIWRMVKEFFSKIFKRMRGMDEDFTAKTPEQRAVEMSLFKEHRRLEDLFVKALRDANRTAEATKAIRTEAQSQSAQKMTPAEAKVENKETDVEFSLAYSDALAKAQRDFLVRHEMNLTEKDLDLAIEQTAEMVSIMEAYSDILPQDKVTRKTLVKNGSYDYSVENTTICVRTLAYNSFVEMVSEKIKRPLSQMESFLVSQKLYEIAKEPQCLYCYVSLDRKAYNEMVLRYIEQRDTAIADYNAAGKPVVNDKLRNDKNGVYNRFLDGRKDTDNMWKRYQKWVTLSNMGTHLLTAEDVATEKRRADLYTSGGVNAEQVDDMLKYAQSASWAKKQLDYTAYNGEILKLSQNIINNLNKHYGLRWYSFSDYSAAFIVENMQQITDAALRGLKGLSYTKDTAFAKIFAPTGMNINISVYVAKDANGNYVVDERQSANLAEAIALREKYPNVGIVVVATDTAGVEWALAQEWSDVVIPFHTVRTGAQVAEFYDWTVFNEEQSDSVSDENLWDRYVDSVAKSDAAKKKVSKMIYPSEHQNDKAKYLSLVKERGLKPRFSQFLDNANYMKLVNETRQSESQTKPLQPKYDLTAAKESFGQFVDKGGYFEGWYNDGIDVDAEVETVANDVLEGKRPDQVDYAIKGADWERAIERRNTNRSHGGVVARTENKKSLTSTESENVQVSEGKWSLSESKIEKLTAEIVQLGKMGIRLNANGKIIRVLTDDLTVDKNIYSVKGRIMKEVNARISAIPYFSDILKNSTYDGFDSNIHSLNNKAKKGANGIHHFKGSYKDFTTDALIIEKGTRHILYEIKFIEVEKEKSSQQSMTDKPASPAPKGDAENKPIVTDPIAKVNPSEEKSLKDSLKGKSSLRDKLDREVLTEAFYGMAETDAEREIVEKYRGEIDAIDAKINEREYVIERLSEIEGKAGFAGEYKRLEGKLRGLNDWIEGRDRRLFELESARPFREMVDRYDVELKAKRATAKANAENSRYAYVSRARLNELLAKERGGKVYTQKDAQIIEDKIFGFDDLSRNRKNIIVDELWQGMNAAKTKAEKEGVIRSVGDMIFEELSKNEKFENPEYQEIEPTLSYLRGYVQRLEFDETQKAEIQHKLDKSGAKSFMGRWQNKKSDGRTVTADVFVTDFARENPGYEYLEDMNVADALFEIDSLYETYKNIDESVDAFYGASTAELQAIRDNIDETLREAFEAGGKTTEAQVRQKLEETISYHRATLAVDREARSIREMKRGTFENANAVQGDRVMEILRQLSKFEYRGTFSVNKFREKVRELNAWYHSDNAKSVLAYTKDRESEYSEFVANTLQEISNGKGRVTADELWAFSKVLAHFRKLAENYNKVWRAGKWEDAVEIARRYVGQFKMSSSYKGAKNIITKAAAMYLDEFADPLSVVRRYDLYNPEGFFTETFMMFRDAAVEREIAISDIMKQYHDFLDKKENKNYLRDIQARYVEVYGEKIPMDQALSLYMMLRQDHALLGFVERGVQYTNFAGDEVIANSAEAKADIETKINIMTKIVMKDYGITEEAAAKIAQENVTETNYKRETPTIEELRATVAPTMQAIRDAMTESDKELLKIIETTMNGPLKDMKRETDLVRLGFSNVMQGFYFPIKRMAGTDTLETNEYHDELQSVSNISANKSREIGARQPLRADSIIRVYERHVKAIATYATLQQSIDFYNRVYNVSITGDANDSQKVSVYANQAWGSKKDDTIGNHKFFNELIDDIQGLSRARKDILNKLIGTLRSGLATAGISLNGKVLMSQLFSYVAAMADMDIGALIKGGAFTIGKVARNIYTREGREFLREYGELVDKYCPLARVRNEDNYAYLSQGVVELEDGTVKIKGQISEKINTAKEFSMKPIGLMDRAVVCALFEACQQEVATEDAPVGSEENLTAAGKRLTQVLLDTQQNAIATEKSRAMRSDQQWIRGLTMFSADAMRSVSRLLDGIGEAAVLSRQLKTMDLTDAARERITARKKVVSRKLIKSAAVILSNAVVMAALTLLFRFLRGKKIKKEEIVEDLALDMFTGLFGGLPLIRDLVEKVTSGYDVTDSALDLLSDFVGTFANLGKTIAAVCYGEEEWGKIIQRLRQLAFAFAQVTGLPVRNVWNAIYGIINMISKDASAWIDKNI